MSCTKVVEQLSCGCSGQFVARLDLYDDALIDDHVETLRADLYLLVLDRDRNLTIDSVSSCA